MRNKHSIQKVIFLSSIMLVILLTSSCNGRNAGGRLGNAVERATERQKERFDSISRALRAAQQKAQQALNKRKDSIEKANKSRQPVW